jgi:hypothetical protein
MQADPNRYFAKQAELAIQGMASPSAYMAAHITSSRNPKIGRELIPAISRLRPKENQGN